MFTQNHMGDIVDMDRQKRAWPLWLLPSTWPGEQVLAADAEEGWKTE